jgi:hypothetical protein
MSSNATTAVAHEPGRFLVRVGGEEAYVVYAERAGVVEVQHTYTPPALRGRGLAERLTEAVVAYATARRLRIVPTCSYTQRFLAGRPELRALVADDPG